MPLYQRPDVTEPERCMCAPSHSNFHGPQGCTHTVAVFRCLVQDCHRRGYSNDHSNCIIEMPCRCKVIGVVPTVEQIVLADERE